MHMQHHEHRAVRKHVLAAEVVPIMIVSEIVSGLVLLAIVS